MDGVTRSPLGVGRLPDPGGPPPCARPSGADRCGLAPARVFFGPSPLAWRCCRPITRAFAQAAGAGLGTHLGNAAGAEFINIDVMVSVLKYLLAAAAGHRRRLLSLGDRPAQSPFRRPRRHGRLRRARRLHRRLLGPDYPGLACRPCGRQRRTSPRVRWSLWNSGNRSSLSALASGPCVDRRPCASGLLSTAPAGFAALRPRAFRRRCFSTAIPPTPVPPTRSLRARSAA